MTAGGPAGLHSKTRSLSSLCQASLCLSNPSPNSVSMCCKMNALNVCMHCWLAFSSQSLTIYDAILAPSLLSNMVVCDGFVCTDNLGYLKRLSLDFIGLDSIWALALGAKNPAVGKAAIDLLITLHVRCVHLSSNVLVCITFQRPLDGVSCELLGVYLWY